MTRAARQSDTRTMGLVLEEGKAAASKECMGPTQPTGTTTIGSATSATAITLLEGAAAAASDGEAAGHIPPSYPRADDEQLPSPSAWVMNEEVGERDTTCGL